MLSRDAYYSLCFAAGAVLLRGPFTPLAAQDAYRPIAETRGDVAAIVERLARRSGDFKDAFDKAVCESNARHRAEDLHDAAKRLADVFHDKRWDKNNPAVRDRADKTIAAAGELNRVMLNRRLANKLQRDWSLLCLDLSALAEVYDLSPLGGED